MGKIKINKKKNKYIITNKIKHPEAINEYELNVLNLSIINNLLAVVVDKKKKYTKLLIYQDDVIPLNEFYNEPITQKIFFELVSRIIQIIMDCRKNRFNLDNLQISMSKLFIDIITLEIYCIYWTIVNNDAIDSIETFFTELPYNFIFDSSEDNSQISDYINFLEDNKPFSINRFIRFINNMLGNDNDQSDAVSTFLEKNNTDSLEDNYNMDNENFIEYNPLDNISNEFNNKEITNNNIYINYLESQIEKTNLIDKPGKIENEGTTILGLNLSSKDIYSYIIRIKNNQKIVINKDVFFIGKDPSACDYVVSDNKAVSRNHSKIIIENDKYYIMDNNSTNKTYVNGERILPNVKAELNDNSTIMLGNEKFIFYKK